MWCTHTDRCTSECDVTDSGVIHCCAFPELFLGISWCHHMPLCTTCHYIKDPPCGTTGWNSPNTQNTQTTTYHLHTKPYNIKCVLHASHWIKDKRNHFWIPKLISRTFTMHLILVIPIQTTVSHKGHQFTVSHLDQGPSRFSLGTRSSMTRRFSGSISSLLLFQVLSSLFHNKFLKQAMK